ncbi:endospore germination permease [Paenibacillus qinlingensis]|uniref:Spore germination protein (Amino acid permease) n=1 Tax=Paenibacillus qinlingensis TaxID=1837343 RepID=A0ABU1NXF2_9BACL|nr:endospore germination permease [Paenibacillus qinlingensis]MDR6552161.1 spore germination protein (amino acid permease) [Paenibacillus qinlingensis]
MDSKQVINLRQLSWLASSIVTSGGILTLQNELIRINQMDAWFSYLLSIIYVFLIAGFFGYITKLYPQKNIFEISKEILGQGFGTCLNLLILFHFWQIVVRDISSVSRFSSTLLLHSTPLEILFLLNCLLLIYFGKTSLEVIARVNDLFYPLFVVTITIMPLLLSNEFFLRLTTPVLTMPLQHWTASSILTLGSAGDVFILGAFLHTIYNSNHVRSAIRHGSLLGFFLLTLILFAIIAVLGPRMPANFSYPTYNLVQTIHVTDFLDRLDLVMLMIWFPTVTCKIIAIYLALLIGITSLFNGRNYPMINKPIGLMLALTTCLSFKSTTELLSFSNFSSPVIVLAYQPFTMVLLLIVGIRKRRKNPNALATPSSSGGTHAKQDPEQNSGKLSQRLTYSHWLQGGNLLLFICVAFILIGLMFGEKSPLIGTICAIGFGSGLLLTTLTTYMETTKLKQAEASN